MEQKVEKVCRPLQLNEIIIENGRLTCMVRVYCIHKKANPQLMEKLVKEFPRLPYHACVNSKGKHFGDVMNETPIPHVLEHVMIELQAQLSKNQKKRLPEEALGKGNENTLFVGTSQWVGAKQKEAKICISFCNDKIALQAMNEALRVLNTLLEE